MCLRAPAKSVAEAKEALATLASARAFRISAFRTVISSSTNSLQGRQRIVSFKASIRLLQRLHLRNMAGPRRRWEMDDRPHANRGPPESTAFRRAKRQAPNRWGRDFIFPWENFCQYFPPSVVTRGLEDLDRPGSPPCDFVLLLEAEESLGSDYESGHRDGRRSGDRKGDLRAAPSRGMGGGTVGGRSGVRRGGC